jgi:hypothetical protein
VRRDRPGTRRRVAFRRGADDHGRTVERRAARACEVVDGGCRERERLVLHARIARRGRGDGELRGDRRPRGIRVAPGQVHASQARSGPGPHERADLGAALVEEIGFVWFLE